MSEERGFMRGMDGCHAPAKRMGDSGSVGSAPGRMACVALFSCALAACGGGDGPVSPTAATSSGMSQQTGQIQQGLDPTVTVTVDAGDATSGSVHVVVDSEPVMALASGSFQVDATDGNAVSFEAVADTGYRFAGWTLSGGLACADGPAASPCVLETGSASAGARASPTFEAIPTTLTVAAGTSGSVRVAVNGADVATVAAGSSRGFSFSVEATATLEAVADFSYRFAGWTLSPEGLACADGPAASPCVLETGSASAGARASPTFEAIPTTLTVAAGTSGSVRVAVNGADVATVAAGSSRGFSFSVEATATLEAVADFSYRFAGWTLSPEGLACESGTVAATCVLAAGSVTADASALGRVREDTHPRERARRMEGPGFGVSVRGWPRAHCRPLCPGRLQAVGGRAVRRLRGAGMRPLFGDRRSPADRRVPPVRGRWHQVLGLRAGGLPRHRPGLFHGLLPGCPGCRLYAGPGPRGTGTRFEAGAA